MGSCCAPAKQDVVKKPSKPLKEWSGDEVKAILKVFKDFDKNNSGFIEAEELVPLCDVLGIESTIGEADKLVKDGKIDPKEFFIWWVGCSEEEAASAFVRHDAVFATLASKPFKEWSQDDVKAVMKVFQDFDKNKSGNLDAEELRNLTSVLCIEAKVSEADTLVKDGLIDPKEFFAWYVGCTAEEAEVAFEQHKSIFST